MVYESRWWFWLRGRPSVVLRRDSKTYSTPVIMFLRQRHARVLL
jgi:hypothetical protein